jgi:signal transduction histidine kinase
MNFKLLEAFDNIKDKRLRLFCYVIFSMGVIDFVSGLLSHLLQFHFIGNIFIVNSLAYFCIFIPLAMTKFETLSRIGLTFYTSGLLFAAGCYYGPEINIQVTPMIGLMYPFLAFSEREWRARLICLLPPGLQFLGLELTNYQALDYLGIESSHLAKGHPGGMMMTLVTMVIVTSSYYIFNWQTEKREKELVLLNKKIEKKAQEFSNLVQIVVHDIANSITIASWSAIALDKKYPHESDVRRVIEATKQTEKIVSNVRSLHAMSLGKTRIKMMPIDLTESINEVLNLLAGQMQNKNIKVLVDLDESIRQCRVLGDASLLTSSVLSNLISNAIKFSPKNSTIEIVARVDNQLVRLEVIDRGIGIPDNIRLNLFNEKQATNRKGTDGEKGTGFGLPIVKSSLELMKGNISVSSKSIDEYPENHGSKFTVELLVAA